MLRKRWILGILFSFLLSACGTANLDTVLEDLNNLDKLFEPEERQGVPVLKESPQQNALVKKSKKTRAKRVPNTTTENMVTTVRLNTAQCSEPDDWYLDGYRVGKSFRYQKEAMYQQRVNYCRNTLGKTALNMALKRHSLLKLQENQLWHTMASLKVKMGKLFH